MIQAENTGSSALGEGANSTQTTPKTPKSSKVGKAPKPAGSSSKKRKVAPKVEDDEDDGQPSWEDGDMDEESKRVLDEFRQGAQADASLWNASQLDEL